MTPITEQKSLIPAIGFKGNLFTLTVIHLVDHDLEQLRQAIQLKIDQAPSFFYRAPVVININKLPDISLDFKAIQHIINKLDLVLVGISGGNQQQKDQAKQQGLAVLAYSEDKKSLNTEAQDTKQQTIKAPEIPAVETLPLQPAKTVRGNIRSGQQVYAKNTDLVIIGSVSHGAEVIADGDIHVYGTLRGKAIAGAKGNTTAKIYCQNLQADLVSISGNYMISENLHSQNWQKAALIELIQEKLIINEL